MNTLVNAVGLALLFAVTSQSPTLVLVDQHEGVREILAYALAAEFPHGRIEGFAEFETAWPQLLSLQPHVVVMDERAGQSLVEGCISQLPSTRWLLYSTSLNAGGARVARARGFSGGMGKGSDYKELILGIKELLAGRQYFPFPAAELALPAPPSETVEWETLIQRLHPEGR